MGQELLVSSTSRCPTNSVLSETSYGGGDNNLYLIREKSFKYVSYSDYMIQCLKVSPSEHLSEQEVVSLGLCLEN